MRWRRAWQLACLLLLILSCAACGSNSHLKEGGQPAQPQASLPAAVPAATTPAAAAPDWPPTRLPTATASLAFAPPTSTPRPRPASPAPACRQAAGQVEAGSLTTELLRQPLEFRVYLPPCYAALTDRRYPVLYLVHGQSYTDDQWDRLGADETADRLISAGEIPPFIIVMPRDRTWSQPTEDPFGQAVVDELIPYIDGMYRTRAGRAYRAVGGLSRGGGWAVHLGLAHWDLFGALGGHSPAIFQTDALQMRAWLQEIPAGQMPRIYLDIGERDRPEILRAALWFEELLTELRIPHEWHLFAGYHEEAYWSAHLEQYLRWYAAGWADDG